MALTRYSWITICLVAGSVFACTDEPASETDPGDTGASIDVQAEADSEASATDLSSADAPPPDVTVGDAVTSDTVISDTVAAEDLSADDSSVASDDVAADTSSDSSLADIGEVSTCSTPLEAPSNLLWPAPGELFYAQIGLGGFKLGEAALVVGPDGTIALIDVGNDSHDDDVRDFLNLVVDQMASDGGFAARSRDVVDHVVITHSHGDHCNGLTDLLADVTVTGRVAHRGFFDITGSVTTSVVEQLCETLEAHPGLELALCGGTAAPCDSGQWAGTYPAADCDGLSQGEVGGVQDDTATWIPLGGDARLVFAGANATMAGDRYETLVGPLLDEDTNGENGRSVVGVLEHGDFRLLFNGDLTGGGSDTDPVESFYVDRISEVTDIGLLGVDVVHAGHHGRNTSSSQAWVDRFTPNDGLSRNLVMGVSTAHLGSPHRVVLERYLDDGRLQEGRAWTTTVTVGGTSHADLINASGGYIAIATRNGGAQYVMQAVSSGGEVLASRAFYAVGTCDP